MLDLVLAAVTGGLDHERLLPDQVADKPGSLTPGDIPSLGDPDGGTAKAVENKRFAHLLLPLAASACPSS